MRLAQVYALCLALLGPSLVNAATARPADVLAEVEATVSATALARWERAIGAFIPGIKLPGQEQVLGVIAKMIGARSLMGLDLDKPLRLLLLDPKRFPNPAVLVGQVSRLPQLKASLLDSPAVATRLRGGVVALGEAAALERAGEYAIASLRAAKPEGLRAVALLQPIWASYGEQARGMKSFLVGSGAAQGQAASAATLERVFDGMLAGIEQSEQLVVELGTVDNTPQLALSLVPRPGSAIARFAEAQRPSDFALLGKLAEQPASFAAAGRLDMGSSVAGLVGLILGSEVSATVRAEMEEMLRLWSGELAMAGEMRSVETMSYQYLLTATDPARMLALLPRLTDLMSASGMMGGQVKMKRTALPPLEAEGVAISQSEVTYDFSALAGHVGRKQFSLMSLWAGWGQTVALATGPTAKQHMIDLLASARRAQSPLVLTSAQRSSLSRARAGKESLWIWIDPAMMPQQPGKPLALPPNLVIGASLGVSGSTPKLRILMLAR